MDFLTDWLTNWLKELLLSGIMGNLEGLFDTVNAKVGEIAVQVGTTPAEKVLKNIIRARFLRPGVRPYQTQNIYAPFAGRGAVRKEDAIAKGKSNQRKKNRKG